MRQDPDEMYWSTREILIDIYLDEEVGGWVNDDYYNNAIEFDNQGIPYYGVYRNFPQSRSFQERKGRKFNWQSLVKLRPFRVRTR